MSNFKVVVRVRPISDREKSKLSHPAIELGDDSSIVVHNVKLESKKSIHADSRCRKKRFYFDRIFWSMDPCHIQYASQKTVYDDLSPDLLNHVFGGYNVCLLAYGQTGSGKTYTMMGNEENPGFIPRLCEGIFDKISQLLWQERASGETVTFNVSASYIEIYNEKVFDLLEPQKDHHAPSHRHGSPCQHRYRFLPHRRHHHHQHLHDLQKHLRVREHPKTGPYVEGLSQHTVKDNLSIQKLIKRGNLFRKTASTRAHNTSSRSHAIFSITFTQANLDADHPMERRSKINLVDLAGSERADSSSEVDKLRMKEGSDINKSLATLGSVIQALAQRSLLLTWSIPSFSPLPSSKSPSPCPQHRRSNNSINKLNCSDNGTKQHKHVYVPYRDSTLTWILKDSLEGNAVSVMIAAISPSSCSYFETINTLYYGQRAKTIVNKPVVNEDPVTKLIGDLKAEIRRLKTLLSDQQNHLVLDNHRPTNTTTSFCQVDTSSSPLPATEKVDLSEQLRMDEDKVDVLTRDFLEKWRRMEDVDVEVNPLNRSTVEIFTNVPHLIGLQEHGDDDDDDEEMGIKIFKLHVGDTIINLSEIVKPEDDDDYDEDKVVDEDNESNAFCIFRNQSNVITILPPVVSSSSSSLPSTPPPLPSCPPPPPSSPPPSSSSPSLLDNLDIREHHSTSPTTSRSHSSSSSSSSSFKVYVNDVLITTPHRPKQGDIIRFGKRLKFRFVNPYMIPRKTKRRRRSLITSHKNHPEVHSFLSNSSPFLRCSSLTSMPVSVGKRLQLDRSADFEQRGDIGFTNVGDRSCLSDLLDGEGSFDSDLTPTLSLTWPSLPGDLVGRDGNAEGTESRGVPDVNSYDHHTEDKSQFRNEMELQISALEKAWSTCLEKEAELRTSHENNKKDIDQRLAALHAREEALKSALNVDHQITSEDKLAKNNATFSDHTDDLNSRNLPKAIEAVENQLELEKEAILRLEKDYRERDERLCEEVGSMHRQIEMLKAQLESLTSKSSHKDDGNDRLSRGFFLQQIGSDHDQFQRHLLASSLCSPFSSERCLEFNSALDVRSGQTSKLSKSLDSISVASCDDSLEHNRSSFEALSSYAPFLSTSSLNGMNSFDPKPAMSFENKQIVESGNMDACGAGNTSFAMQEIDGDPKLKFAKRLSPVGSEYDHSNEPSDLLHLVDSPKCHPSVEVITTTGTFIDATITTVTLDSIFSVPNAEKIVPADPSFGAQLKLTMGPVHENDSDFSDFSIDSLDHRSRPLTISNPVYNFHGNIPLETEDHGSTSVAFIQNIQNMQNSDSKGDSGADCSSSGSTTGEGNGGKEEDELDLEKTICAVDGAFSQYFTGEDDDDNDGEDNDSGDKITTCSVISVEEKKRDNEVNKILEGTNLNSDALESFQEVLAASSVSSVIDVTDWEGFLNRVSLPQMPLRSSKSLEKNKMKSVSTNSLKTSVKDTKGIPESANLYDESSISTNEKHDSTESPARIVNNKNVSFEGLKMSPTSFGTTDEPGFRTTSNKIASTMTSLPAVDSDELFLSELKAEIKSLEKYEVSDDDIEDKVDYFLKGDKLLSLVPKNSFNREKSNLKDETVNTGETSQEKGESHHGFDSCDRNDEVSEDDLRQTAANYISYIFKSLESKSDNTALKISQKQIESPKDFNCFFSVQTDSNPIENSSLLADSHSDDLPRIGSGNGKHVRFELNKTSGLENENVIDKFKDAKTFDYRHQLNKRSSLSLGNLSDSSDKDCVEMSRDSKRSLNFKRRSEDNISTRTNFTDMSDLELGRDGRMRIKKHKKRPNLMDIEFDHNGSTLTDNNKEDDIYRCGGFKSENNFDTFSKNSVASNDSGVSSFSNESLVKTTSPNLAFEEDSYSVNNVELLSNNISIGSQVVAPQIGPGIAAPLSDRDYKKVESREDLEEHDSHKLSSTFTAIDLIPQSLLDYSAPLNENYEDTFKPGDDQNLEHVEHSQAAAYSQTNQFSYSKSPRNSSDVDTAFSDNGSFGNVSVSCDGTESGDSEGCHDLKCHDDEPQEKECVDDIYETIQMYRSAVAKAEELISGKFSNRKNGETEIGLTERDHLSTPYLDYQTTITMKDEQCIHNILAKETNQKVRFTNKNNSDDNKQDARTASNKTCLPRVDHKGVSCDLTERQFDAYRGSEGRQFYYDKTEVLGFDCYPPMESFYFKASGPNPKVLNLVMGSKTQLCYPTESSQDKQFEYFGLQPIQEHFEPTFTEDAYESLDDTLVASVLIEEPQDSELSDLVRCSYNIEIKPNVALKKDIFNAGDDEEFVRIAKDFPEEASLTKRAEESESMDSLEQRAQKTVKVSFSNEQPMPSTERSSATKYIPSYLQQKEFDDFNESRSDNNAEQLSYGSFSESTKQAHFELFETRDLNFIESPESFESEANTELDAKAEYSVIPTTEKIIYPPSQHSLTQIQGQTSYNVLSSKPGFVKENTATAPPSLHVDFRDSPFASSESTNKPLSELNVVVPRSPERPKYVSELKIFLDSATNDITPSRITNNNEVKLFNGSSKSAETLSDFSSPPKAQSRLTDRRTCRSTSNLVAMSELSKSDEDLLGEDSKLFEGLMPNYKELPSSLSGTSKVEWAERLHSNVARGALDDFYERVDHDKTAKEFSNVKLRELSFPVYDETVEKFQVVDTRDSSHFPVERKHSTSLDDLRSPEHKAKRQGTYDSIDSITLVLVDPDVDEVCGRETRQFLNGHSSLKNVSQYGVGIQSIVDDSKDNLLYETDDDKDDDDENTIEAPLAGGEPSSEGEEEMGSAELDLETNGSGDYTDDDRDDVKCFVLNEYSISKEEADLLSNTDDRGASFDEMLLCYRDDCSVGSLKEFSQVLESSAPVKDDSRTMLLHHSHPTDDKLNVRFTPVVLEREQSHVADLQQLHRCFSTDIKNAKTSSHVSVFINDPQNTHVSVYDTTFRNSRECLSVANIRQFIDSPPSCNRTIETQTYPERRVIETQTSPISQRKTLDLSDNNSQSTKPTEDVSHHIQNVFTDLVLDGSKSPWHARVPRADSLKSSELRDQSFSTETRQASESESSYLICKNNVSTWVTDSEFSEGILQLATPGRSSKTAADENSLNEVPLSHAAKNKLKEKSRSPKTDKKPNLLTSDVISPPSYTDRVRMSNSMTEVRTCIEDEFEPTPFTGDKIKHLSRLHPMKIFQTVENRRKDQEFGKNGMLTPSNLSSKDFKQHVKDSSKSRKLWSDTSRHILVGSPVHDSGLEDRCTNTPLWLSDRGSASPGVLHGNRSVQDAWTNTEEKFVYRRKTHSLSRLNGGTPRRRHDDWKREINRLKREKRRMIEMLARQVVPSKVQIELSEAQLNYHIGQTDLYLNLLEESAYPSSEVLRTSRSHSVDHFYEDGSILEMFDYPTIRFDQGFLSRHCRRLEASRRKIEERLSNIEWIRSGRTSSHETSEPTRNFLADQRSDEKIRTSKKDEGHFTSTISSHLGNNRDFAAVAKSFHSHRVSSLNSPHYQDADGASRRLGKRPFGSDHLDSLHFDRTSDAEESEFYSPEDVALGRSGQPPRVDEFRKFKQEFNERTVLSGRKCRQEGFECSTPIGTSKVTSSSDESCTRIPTSLTPGNRQAGRTGSPYQDDDDNEGNSFRLVADCYEARVRARDEIRKSLEFLHHAS